MTRRQFLHNGAIAAQTFAMPQFAVPGLSMAKGFESKAESRVRLGVCSYSFHKFDRSHVISFLKKLSCTRLNAKDVNDHLPATSAEATGEAVAAYRAAGVELTAAGVIYFPSSDAADIGPKFEYAKRAGVELIVASPAREALSAVESFVKQYDIRMAIHNHGPEDKQWPSPLDVLTSIEAMDARLGLCIDVGHTVRAGTDVVQAIRAGGARVFDVHMKDLADLAVKESQVAVGDGKIPVRAIFAALDAIGYKGFVDLEYEIQEDDPLPGMVKSFAYMRGVLAGMGS